MSFLSRLFLGVDLDEEQRRSNALDAELAALNAARLQARLTDEDPDNDDDALALDAEYRANLARDTSAFDLDVDDAVFSEFRSGLADGFDNVTGAIRTSLDVPRRFLFASIPWYFWLAAALFAWWYLTGGKSLKGLFARG